MISKTIRAVMKLLPIVSHRIDPTKFSKSGICYKGFVVKVLQGVFAENFQLYSASEEFNLYHIS